MIVSLELAPELGNDLDLWQEKEITTGNRQPLQLGEQPPASETCGGSGGSAARRHGSAAVHVRPVSLALLRPMDEARYYGKLSTASRGKGRGGGCVSPAGQHSQTSMCPSRGQGGTC